METNADHHQRPLLPRPSFSNLLLSSFYPRPLPYPLQIRDFCIEQIGNASNTRNHELPPARIKKIMKSDPNVNMIAGEAPILLSKACEMLIVDLTMRSWLNTVERGQKKLKRSDISVAVTRGLSFTFLVDIVPRDESVNVVDPRFVDMLIPRSEDLPPGMVLGHPVVGCNGMYFIPPQMQELPAAPCDGEEEEAVGDGEEAAGDLEEAAGDQEEAAGEIEENSGN
ncbi:PREDICTED: nuclear transcription factor Y subunit C-7-like [Camelina sativa]|uniref:Nuclear transcription factor Y subunit C-7-like n=1 Tax=Camelina sativa TaxID=90675 RepID=A0ABM0XF47_CAMSA|nr:PREDICTED: nuclear transcription factor Y subunit C-7-like [Camelina sativa]